MKANIPSGKYFKCLKRGDSVRDGSLFQDSAKLSLDTLGSTKMPLLDTNLAFSTSIFTKLDKCLWALGVLVWISQEQIMLLGY